MGFFYTIDDYNPFSLTFNVRGSGLCKIDLKDEKFINYKYAQFFHWTNTLTKEIKVFKELTMHNFLERDGVVYKRATQYDYDFWKSKIFPEGPNAAVFKKLEQVSKEARSENQVVQPQV